MPSKSKRSLQDVVGKETYDVWVDMLRELVPDGRTHRLSVVIAGMLLYAVDKSMQIKHRNEEEYSVAMSLIDATDTSDPDSIKELIHDIVDRLFKMRVLSMKGSASAASVTALPMKSIMNFRVGTIIRGISSPRWWRISDNV